MEADRVYREGANILILSDRGVDENHVAIPSLLAVSLNQHLVKTKKRTSVALILESGSHQGCPPFATLLGFTVPAPSIPIWPGESIKELIDNKMLDITMPQ